MLTCAIPKCTASEKFLRSGSLHLIDVVVADDGSGQPVIQKKMVWLCEFCTQTHTVQTWRDPGQQIRAKNSICSQTSMDLLETPAVRVHPRTPGS